jgi:alpha-beta hydrolase superfamily lysophospholipase
MRGDNELSESDQREPGLEQAQAPAAEEEAQLESGVFYRHWPVPDARGVILLVHGLGEHSGRYRDFADFMRRRGLAVVAPDHPGHGLSPGRRAFVRSAAEFMAPLDALRDLIDMWYPGSPCFLVGHSMGGLIAARYLLDHQGEFAGAALSGAALQMPEAPSMGTLLFMRLISVLWPSLGVLQLDASQVSRDPEVVQRYIHDPLVHGGKISARLVTELFAMMDAVAAGRATITLPMLIMHGDADAMTPAAGSRIFHDAIGSSDKRLEIYPGLYHEIFNEPERLQVLGELADWIMAHIAPSG